VEFNYYGAFVETAEVRSQIHVGNLTYNDGSKVEEFLKAVSTEYCLYKVCMVVCVGCDAISSTMASYSHGQLQGEIQYLLIIFVHH